VVAGFLYFLALGLLTPTLPRFVADELRGGPRWAGLAVGAFTLGALAFRPAIGPLTRSFGSRAALQVGVSLVALSLGGLTAAQNPQIVVALRLIMGCGEAMFFVTASAVVFQLAAAAEARKAQALFSASVYVALIVGPAIGESIRVALGYGPIWSVAALLAATSLIALPRARTLEVPVAASPSRPEVGALGAILGPAVAMSALIVPMVGFTTFVALYGAHIGLPSVQAPFIVFASTVLLLRTVGAGLLELVPFGWPLGVLLSAGAAGAIAIVAAPTLGGLILGAMLVGVSQSIAYPMLLTMAVNRAGPLSSLSAVTLFTGAFDAASGLGIVGLAFVLEATNFQVLFALVAFIGLFGAVLASMLNAPSGMNVRPQAPA
jgi:hypothetical protein